MTERRIIYLDYNATAPIRDRVVKIMTAAMANVGNPSSVHSAGRRARFMVEDARRHVAHLVGAHPANMIFTSSGTEATNLAIRGQGFDTILIGAGEHEATLAAAKASGASIKEIKLDSLGHIDLAHLEQLLEAASGKTLVSVMVANNEVGTLQSVERLVTLARQYGAKMHTDAVQAAGKIPLNFAALGADYMTLSSHKIGGPQGVGALVLGDGVPLQPLIVGGGQELGRRSGTENVAGVVGFGEAALLAAGELEQRFEILSLRQRLEEGLKDCAPEAIIIGDEAERLPGTSCICLPGVSGEVQVMHMDLEGICVSSGSACSSGKVKASHVLTAMGLAKDQASSSIRVSLGFNNTVDDVDRFLIAYEKLVEKQRKKAG